jgi:hypothetical protein
MYVSLRKVRVNNQGYDNLGRYYGVQTEIVWKYYLCYTNIPSQHKFGNVFAHDRETAKIRVKKELEALHGINVENIKFYR